jgi:hypothetical protein
MLQGSVLYLQNDNLKIWLILVEKYAFSAFMRARSEGAQGREDRAQGQGKIKPPLSWRDIDEKTKEKYREKARERLRQNDVSLAYAGYIEMLENFYINSLIQFDGFTEEEAKENLGDIKDKHLSPL